MPTGDLEAFHFEWHAGHIHLDMYVSRSTVSLWNQIFHYEAKREHCRQQLNQVTEEEAAWAGQLSDIHRQAENARGNHFLHGITVAQEMQDVQRAAEKRGLLETNLRRIETDLALYREKMNRNLKQLLAENNLYLAAPKDGVDGSENGYGGTRQGAKTQPVRPPPTREAKDAVVDMNRKEKAYHNARRKLHHWQDYYNQEEVKFIRGIRSTTRTEFDVNLLREQMDTTRALNMAKHEFEKSRQHLCQTAGLVIYSPDQESGFGSCGGDGYTGSEEQDLVGSVDRAWIERWMAGDGDRTDFGMDCDQWDSRSIELWESHSAVGKGKKRVRIDRWRQMCEQIRKQF